MTDDTLIISKAAVSPRNYVHVQLCNSYVHSTFTANTESRFMSMHQREMAQGGDQVGRWMHFMAAPVKYVCIPSQTLSQH